MTNAKQLMKLLLLTLIAGLAMLPLMALAQDGTPPAAGPEQPNILLDASVVVGPLLLLGLILKNAWTAFPNRLIPLVMLVLGMPLYMVKSGAAWSNADAWVTAFMCVATAVGVHSGIKNTLQKDEEAKPGE